MNCREAQDRLTETIDLRGSLFIKSPNLAMHLASCSSCRKEARRMKAGLSILATAAKNRKSPAPPRVEKNIMELIVREAPLNNPGAQNPISFRDWIVVGFIILIGLCTLPFSSEAPYMLIITVSIFLTLYGSLFIGTHLEELSYHFGLRH